MTNDLRREYEAFLRRNGVALPKYTQVQQRAKWQALWAQFSTSERAFLGGSRESHLKDRDLFGHLAKELQLTMTRAGISLPTEAYVNEYPHEEFNARACAVQGGTLILINTGFSLMVHEISKILAGYMLPFTRDTSGSIVIPDATAAELSRLNTAETALASTVLAYLFQGDTRYGNRMPMEDKATARMALEIGQAIERFIVAHEFAHLLEGHLGTPAEQEDHDWLHRTREQEFQADETGALLVLRGLKETKDPLMTQLMTCLAVAGPLLFFMIDHLITRIRKEVDDIPHDLHISDHPTSDDRAAALRPLFAELYGSSVLHMADASVQVLSQNEDRIVAAARRILSA